MRTHQPRHSALDAESLSIVREFFHIPMCNIEILGQAQDDERTESANYLLKMTLMGSSPH